MTTSRCGYFFHGRSRFQEECDDNTLCRKHGALKQRELTQLDYGSVSMALQRLEQRRPQNAQFARRLRELEALLLN